MKAYYDARAQEYDDWYLGVGLYADRDRPGWDEELAGLVDAIGRCRRRAHSTSPAVPASSRATSRARSSASTRASGCWRSPRSECQRASSSSADALELPFEDGSFDRLFTGHFYGHLEEEERERFLGEARRVARELVIVDSSVQHSPVDEEFQPRVLRTDRAGRSTSATSRARGSPTSWAAARRSSKGHWFVVVRSPA